MRELKFRVWDKRKTKFIYEYDASHKRLAISFHGKVYSGLYDDVLSENEYIIQQYTGLKDKIGVEIYEGDIVKATSDQYTNENFVGKVIFDEGCFLTWINKNDIRGIWGEDDIEVIGNIFENSEHLEK